MADKKKILIIDDDPDIREVCRLVLERVGHAVVQAATGAEGRELVGKQRPDLIILDIMMEEADAGFQTARWLAEKHPGIPVVMLSSIAESAEQLFDTSTLKLAELVNKPIAAKDLESTVQRLLARSGRGA